MIFITFGAIPAFAENNIPTINSEAAVLIDAVTGQILFEKNMNKKEYPASITKIMTGMLALENSKLNDIIVMTKEAVFSVERNSSHIALDIGEEIVMRDALYALAVKSANDAANGIGVHVSGNLEDFAKLMNKRAKELGALNTHFVTTNGLDNPNHYTTAYDMALIMKQAINTPHFLEFFNQKSYEIPPTNMQEKIRLIHNKNSLLTGRLKYEGIIASKTGWTSEAKHTLVTAAKRGNRVLIVVSMNSKDAQVKYEDTINLFDYGFNNFQEISINQQQLINSLPNNEDSKELREFINMNNPNIKSLLHKNLTLEDVTLSYQLENSDGNSGKKLRMELKLKNASEFMYPDLGNFVIKQAVKKPVQAVNGVHKNSFVKMIGTILLKILEIFMYIVLFFIGFAIFKAIVMKYLRYRYRKKKGLN